MPNPWEKYQSQTQSNAPWLKYQAETEQAPQQAPMAQEEPIEKKNFFERVGEDFQKRYDITQDIKSEYKKGNLPATSVATKAVGQSAALAQDIVGEGIVSAFRALPDFIEQPIREEAAAVVESPIGQIGIKAIQAGGEQWGEYKKEHPQTANLIEDTLNVAGLMAMLSPKQTLKAGAKTTKEVGKVAVKPVMSTAKGTKQVFKGMTARTPEQLDDALSNLKESAAPLFEKSKEAGVVFNKNRAKSMVRKINKSVDIDVTRESSKRIYGDTMSVLNDMNKDLQAGGFGLNDLHQIKRTLNKVVQKNIVSNPADAEMARQAIGALDDAISNLKPIDIVGGNTEAVNMLKQGISEWARLKRFETVSDVVKKAGGDPNKLQSGMKRLLENKKKIAGFSKQEKAIIRSLANPSAADHIMKGLGRFGIEPNNVFLPLIGGGVAAGVGSGGAGAVLVGTGTVARQARKFKVRGQAEGLLGALENAGKLSAGQKIGVLR